MKKILIFTLILIAVIGFLFLLLRYISEKKEKEQLAEVDIKKEKFNKDCSDLKELIAKAVVVKYIGIEDNQIIFDITNHTKNDIKMLRFDVFFRNDFGDPLQYNKKPFIFQAISHEEALKSNSISTISYHLSEISKDLMFNIYDYKNHLKADVETNRFFFTSGEQFSYEWTYLTISGLDTDGPFQSKELLKKCLIE